MALSPDEFLSLAKRTLSLPPDASAAAVPKCYLKELERHLNLYADDTNFAIRLQPGTGLGIVRCLEEGCNIDIPLVPRISVADGGKRDGLGSLSGYRTHISNHPAHKQSRLKRLKAEQARKLGKSVSTPASTSNAMASSSSQVKTPSGTPKASLLSVLDASFDTEAPTSRARGSISMPSTPPKYRSSFAPPKAASGEPERFISPFKPPKAVSREQERYVQMFDTATAKAEPIELTVPRKRYSDSTFPTLSEESDVTSHLSSSPVSLKKQRLSSPPLLPPSSDAAEPVAGPSGVKAAADVDDIREQIFDVQADIAHLQPQIDRIARKKTKTKGEVTRLANLNARMAAFKQKRDDLTTSLPSSTMARSPKKEAHAPERAGQVRNIGPTGPYGYVGRQFVQFGTQGVRKPEISPFARPEQKSHTPKVEEKPVVFKRSESRAPEIPRHLPFSPVASGSNAVVKMDVDEKTRVLPRGPENLPPGRDFSEPLDDIPLVPGRYRDDPRFDEDGDFYGRGKDKFAGPVAKADDIDKFLVAAGNAEQFDGNASVDSALEKLGLQNLFDTLPGMTVALMPHQAIGVKWMLEKEKSHFKGGCMADEMGLGKTVQMMSVIVTNQSSDPMQKTTLIVAPLALLDQWQLELQTKTDCGLKCLIYHGAGKPKKKSDLIKYDVVLTTYGTLAMEWPDPEAEEKAQKARKQQKPKKDEEFIVSDSEDSDEPVKKKSKKKTLGLLFQVDWWRIVLDEAQNIRNKRTRASRAVTKLSSKYRWCLSGTPIINGLADAYGLLRFLEVRPWYDWNEFNSHVVRLEKKNPSMATTRLQVIFKSMLIRRKKDSMLDGKRLIELPAKTIELHKLQFTEEEREIYKMVEVKSQAVFNRFLRAGTVLKNYHQVLVMLLRLRQICSHPALIYEEGEAYSDPGDEDDSTVRPEAKTELARAAQLISPDFVARMRFKFKQAALHRMQAEKESADATVDDEECPVCLDAMVDPVLTPCAHVFCRECIINVLNQPHVDDQNNDIRYKADERPCPSCRAPISFAKLFSRLAFEPSDEELTDDSERVDISQVMKKSKKGKGKAKPGSARKMMCSSDAEEAGADDVDMDDEEDEEDEEDDDDMRDFIVDDDADDDEEYGSRRPSKKAPVVVDGDDEDGEFAPPRANTRKGKGKARAIILDSDDEEDAEVIFGKKEPEPERPADGKIRLMSKFLPSTKMKHMMESLREWSKTNPDEKVLIISQWTSCLDLVSNYLSENGMIHVKYQGSMNRAMRDRAVRVFMAKDKAKYMLMSLKCGGVGLNLTRANRVISLDLGWSEAVEHQAFDRVHRLGQHRPVFVDRLVIENTVEDRILALQERKRNLAEGSLGEGAGKKIGRLSVRELANLFGMDTRGRLIGN
ncbi:hypothetical protein GLOTRDRAFT_139677 [Gloeophyllum trabeum ATCC 11539]|uniref:Uncharacterized protein n=1 Tax=Gloeophyllum trabeum (strain ATCC 11539 / FP-39264 / Madison 617) TaxID=670483 RepID=S7Q0Y5_GLOTA|nr:uncharacterized protein GLOTRDRAFT_139677 [Gloeophyllum trabeum ATCC 11539]EPQ53423.1 hypothetical protein GLOTRDRAFT_139677 [Gloeophyllum trabeum ATCC 11539]